MAAIQRFGAIYNKQQTQCLEKNNLCKDCILILEPCFEVLLVLVNKKNIHCIVIIAFEDLKQL